MFILVYALFVHQVAGGGKSAKAVSYPFFIACISLLDNMELVKLIYLSATKGSHTSELTKGGHSTALSKMEISLL